jgi:hypothetical protein
MLKMKVAPQSLLKTKGQKKCSSGVHENTRVMLILSKLHDMQGVRPDFSPQARGANFWSAATRRRFPSPQLVTVNTKALTSQRLKKR